MIRASLIAMAAMGLSLAISAAPAPALAFADDPAKPASAKPVVVLETTMGNVSIELDPENAPITAKNFLTYVDAKFYDGLVFHRVIPGFMIQGGGMKPNLSEPQTLSPIKNESDNGLKNARGTIAMARTNAPNSATAQFFINVKDNAGLNGAPGRPGYAVFGKVVEGMDVVDKIVAVRTTTKTAPDGNDHDDVPVEAVIIKSARRKAAK